MPRGVIFSADTGKIESNYSLGHVVVQGDLGAIDSNHLGSFNGTVGLSSLAVQSLGEQGVTTQAAGGTLLSTIYGSVGSITVQKDMVDTQIDVVSNTAGVTVNGNIGSIFIGGNLDGGSDKLGGSVTTDGNIGSVVIGRNLAGGSGQNSGSFQVGGNIGSVSVDNMIGYKGNNTGQGQGSASIVTGTNKTSKGGIGAITITGNLEGGDGDGSGRISQTSLISGSFGSTKIDGAILGGSGKNSGELNANSFGSISIGTGITGSTGSYSGSIDTPNGIGGLTILAADPWGHG